MAECFKPKLGNLTDRPIRVSEVLNLLPELLTKDLRVDTGTGLNIFDALI